MVETRDQLESSRARLAQEAYSLRRERDRLYEKLRKLENAVRDTCVIGERIETDKLYRLRQMVPVKTRPTITQRRKGKGRR